MQNPGSKSYCCPLFSEFNEKVLSTMQSLIHDIYTNFHSEQVTLAGELATSSASATASPRQPAVPSSAGALPMATEASGSPSSTRPHRSTNGFSRNEDLQLAATDHDDSEATDEVTPTPTNVPPQVSFKFYWFIQ